MDCFPGPDCKWSKSHEMIEKSFTSNGNVKKLGEYCNKIGDCGFDEKCDWNTCVDFDAVPKTAKVFIGIVFGLFTLFFSLIIYRYCQLRRQQETIVPYWEPQTSFTYSSSQAVPISSGPISSGSAACQGVPISSGPIASAPIAPQLDIVNNKNLDAPPTYTEALSPSDHYPYSYGSKER